LDLKIKQIIVMISSFGSQNETDFGLSVAPQNQRREDGVRHASRSDSLLCPEASRIRISQSDLKTAEGATTGGASGTIMEVVSSTC
jgi:hypothetical protein